MTDLHTVILLLSKDQPGTAVVTSIDQVQFFDSLEDRDAYMVRRTKSLPAITMPSGQYVLVQTMPNGVLATFGCWTLTRNDNGSYKLTNGIESTAPIPRLATWPPKS